MASSLLREAGVTPRACADLGEFRKVLDDDVCLAVVTEEALRHADLRPTAAWVEAQPSWSDLPFVILTERGGGPERNPGAARLSEALGNVTFLERPFHPTTFVSVAQSALKGRQRQYEVRARIEELREGEERLRQLNETLEERVAERTAELRQAHRARLEEIEQRQRAEEQLRQAQKMEIVGQLTGGVAHDFNNLLMAVLGNLELLRKHLRGDAKATRLIDRALQGAWRGASLTQRLLAFARRQDLKVEPRSLVELVEGMADLLHRSLGPQVELRTELPDMLPRALVDANQLELAVLNLAINARDAMPNGGTLSVTLDRVRAAIAPDRPAADYVRVIVGDTGHGMDQETLRRATEPFFSTKEMGKGTGLGLSMVHGLAVQLNGALRLFSEVGRGTRAELWLPATVDAECEAPVETPEPASEDSPRATILVVDDDALIAMSTGDMLLDLGHDVITAESGPTALEILRDGRDIDLMITDYSMPRMTGAQLAVAARELRPALPILLATGYAEIPDGASVELPRLGKPYQQTELAAEIGRILSSRPA